MNWASRRMYNTHIRAILYVLYGLILGVCGLLLWGNQWLPILLCFSGCLSTSSTFKFKIDRWVKCDHFQSSNYWLWSDPSTIINIIVLSFVNPNVEEVDKQPENHVQFTYNPTLLRNSAPNVNRPKHCCGETILRYFNCCAALYHQVYTSSTWMLLTCT